MINKLICAAGGILLLASAVQTTRAADTVWCDDAIPAGAWTTASGGDSWDWISSNPSPYSGTLAHQSAIASGIHLHAFSGATATLAINTGDTLYTYVYLDPANPPQEVMLEWYDGSSWAHAAYWGANLIPWGVNGTASQYPAGALPATGQWVRLEVPASAVGLEGATVSGMQFILYDGRATFDDSGKGSASADTTPPTVAFAAPASGATVSGSTVAISANASDNVGVASVQFTLDGANLGSAFTSAPYSLTWDSTTVADGAHTLGATATDAAGNTALTAITVNVSNSSGGTTNLAAAALPGWVGPALFNWKPKLGGVCWMDSRAVMKEAAPYVKQSSRPVLVDIKTDATGFGYRFDENSWASDSSIRSWFNWDGTDAGTPTSPEDALQYFGATSNAQFILNIPIPLNLTNQPSANWGYDGWGYTWQTPAFYAAWVQYLTGTADAPSVWQGLATNLDFFSQPANFNWADLRAARGHVAPYSVVAFIIGSEPYNIEGTPTGALYGPQAEKFRVAIRARGYTGPLGLHVHDGGYVDNPQGMWFWPMMTNVTASDFSYFDLEHYYQFSSVSEDFKRTFPVSVNPNAANWMPQSQWKSDYTKFLWIVPDTRAAVRDDNTVPGLGDPSRWNLGWSEHGIQITSQFMYNDMFSAMQWANWLAESMRQNIAWDSSWTLVAEGFSHAQLQVRNGYVTRTPMFFVYQMAQDFYGYDYLTNSFTSPMGSTVDNQGNAVQYPWTTVRVFRDPATGNLHLWVVNQSTNSTATITGFENWNVIGWKQLTAPSYTNSNPLGVPGPEPIQPIAAALPALGQSLVIPPISVNHIILSGGGASTNVTNTIPPTVSLTAPLNNAVVSGSSVPVSASASDNVGVASVQFKLDGVNLGSAFTAAPYGGNWDSTTVADGAHTLTAVATDSSGNQSTATPITILVSNTVSSLSLPTVSLSAGPATAVIGTTNYAVVTIARTGDTTQPLTVNYTLGGTAVKWDDYYLYGTGDMPVSVTIPAGAILTNLVVVARGNETGANPETATFTLATNAAYGVGSPASATITIISNTAATTPLPAVTVTATAPNASRVGPTNGVITVTRTGDTSAALTVNYSLGGTAANGADYVALGTALTIPAGAASAAITVAPLPSASYVGPETAVLTLSANSAYTTGATGNATVTIAGNNVPCTIGSAPGHNVKITWNSIVGKAYRVAYKTSLAGTTWMNLSGLITATGTTTSYTDTTASKSTTRYYLVYVTD